MLRIVENKAGGIGVLLLAALKEIYVGASSSISVFFSGGFTEAYKNSYVYFSKKAGTLYKQERQLISIGNRMPGSDRSPCAACKLLRRRCAQDCVFAPYFPPDEPHKFACVHKVFGASNVNKVLQDLPWHQRGDAVSSMVYEANARMRDPIYGCVGAVSSLQQQVAQLQTQLAVAQAEIMCIRMHQATMASCLTGQGIILEVSPPHTLKSRQMNQHYVKSVISGLESAQTTELLWTSC